MQDAQEAASPVAVLMAVMIAIAFGATLWMVVSGIGADPEFTATALEADRTPGELHMELLAGEPVPLRGSHLRVEVDGSTKEVPLEDLAGQTGDGRTWRAGDRVCIVGGDAGCVFQEGSAARVMLVVGNQLVYDQRHTVPSAQVGGTGGNTPPTAVFSYAVSGREVQFDASGSSDPDGDGLTYAWDFGDGESGGGVDAIHTYASDDDYTVVLRVDDGDGGQHTAEQQVAISGPACIAFEDTDGDQVYSEGVDVALTDGELDDGQHDSATGLVVPSCHGALAVAGKIELKAVADARIDVDLTSHNHIVEVDSSQGAVHLVGSISAHDKIEIKAKQEVLVQGDLSSATNQVEVKSSEGNVEAPGTTMDARDKVELHAKGSINVTQAVLTSQANAVEVQAEAALRAEASTITAQGKIELEGCPVTTEGAVLAGSETEIKSCP